jgi:hypothetical protein
LDIFIRAAVDTDYDQVCNLLADAHAIHVKWLPEVFGSADPDQIMLRALFQETITDTDKTILVASKKNELVDVVLIRLASALDDPAIQPEQKPGLACYQSMKRIVNRASVTLSR